MSDIPDRMQAAADRLHHLVAGATPGDWTPRPVTYFGDPKPKYWEISAQHQQCAPEGVVTHQYHEGGGIDTEANATYIVTMQPRAAALLADYLHSLGGELRLFESLGHTLAVSSSLLALVDRINAAPAGGQRC